MFNGTVTIKDDEKTNLHSFHTMTPLFVNISSLVFSMLNDIVINPSLISTKSDNQIGIMIRDQWTGFDGA